MTMRRKRPCDPIALANLIGNIATGQVGDVVEDKRDPAAVELGRRGGLKGGKARARSLSAAKRKAIAKKGARARWAKKPRQSPARPTSRSPAPR